MPTSRNFWRFFPHVLAAIFATAATAYDAMMGLKSFPMHVTAGTMALGMIVAGFTATQRNMLLSMTGSKILRFAAKTDYYKDILHYLRECIYAGLFVTAISLFGLFISECGLWREVWLFFWVGSITLTICILVRNEILSHLMFTLFMKEQLDED